MAVWNDNPDVATLLTRLGEELDRRKREHERVDPYASSPCPLPPAIERAGLTKAYRFLMPMADAPFGSLIVDSSLDRLEPDGLRDRQSETAASVGWEAWQRNGMDAESKLAHVSALTDGRAFALVWPSEDEPSRAEISLDDSTQMVVQYAEGSRQKRTAAMRRWIDDENVPHATVYTPEALWKFSGAKDEPVEAISWQPRRVDGEDWPLPNALRRVPAVEVAFNRKLASGRFPPARGEFAHCTGLLDRINLLTFLGLVVAFWLGFPLRGVIGEKILRDDDGNVLPPFDATADSVFQLENPNAKTVEYGAADRKNLSVFAELDQLAVITKTPRHYFPLEQGMSNLSAEAIMASEGGLHAKITSHKGSAGEAWEEVLRLAAMIEGEELSPLAELQWRDHEFRSIAERADAAVKLKDLLPWQVIAERFLNFSAEEIARAEQMRAGDPLAQIMAAAMAPPAVPPVPAPTNGNVPPAVPAPQG